MKKNILISVVLPAAMVLAVSACAGTEKKIQWHELPAPVQKTIADNAGAGTIVEIEKETKTRYGSTVTVYEAEVKKPDGKKVEIKVGEDGKLIEIDDD
ncbi:MAG: hypothetical protein H0X43_12360 [Nitrosospira sp.]|nr:hypothetical protein [Nitrosospira sp.]